MDAAPFHFSDAHQAKLVARFGTQPHGLRFIGDLHKLVDAHVRLRDDRAAVPATSVIRSNASAVQKAAQQLAACVARLGAAEQELLGQLMWTIDKQRYYPRGFSVAQLAQSVRVLEQAARQLTQGAGQGGRARLQLDGLIRDVHATYVMRFNTNPALSMAKDNDFTFALKICLDAAGERPKALLQFAREALRA